MIVRYTYISQPPTSDELKTDTPSAFIHKEIQWEYDENLLKYILMKGTCTHHSSSIVKLHVFCFSITMVEHMRKKTFI